MAASGRKRRSCVTGHLLRVRLTERALSLTHCAPEARFRLSQCASETGFYCALGRSSLRAATPNIIPVPRPTPAIGEDQPYR
jgi:hypothetical protein